MKRILKAGKAEIVIKKSKFITEIIPIETEEEGRDFVSRVKKDHYKATHNVPVYTLGEKYEKIKYSDDGEPSGTAAKPMLNVIQMREIINVAVVVTRYFGGIKLGAGGLVRAYSSAVVSALDTTEIVELDNFIEFSFAVDYPKLDLIEYELSQKTDLKYSVSYAENVVFNVTVKSEQYQTLIEELKALLLGKYAEITHREFYGYVAIN